MSGFDEYERANWDSEQIAAKLAQFRALLAEALVTDHVWYGEPEDGHAPDCPGCDLEHRIRDVLNDGGDAGA